MTVVELPEGVERILFTEERIAARIREVAAEISERYRDEASLKLIGVLKGSVFFLTALARELTIPVKIDFLAISTFSGGARAPGMVRIAKDLDTRSTARMCCWSRTSSIPVSQPGTCCRRLLAGVRFPLGICTLLDRTTRRIVQVPVEYRCFEIPDRFVVGWGLDFRQLYRNLPYIAVMNPDPH